MLAQLVAAVDALCSPLNSDVRQPMYPNAFLKTLWRAEVLDSIFVAMSFEPRFSARFTDVIKPAIETEAIAGTRFTALRVDISKSGDSILTEIVTGIAHSRLVLADVSVIDEGRYTQVPIRNANVMYGVGVALACRASTDVLLVRDDNKPLLFDLSTIPTLLVDFSDTSAAIAKIRAAIADRVTEDSLLEDARVRQAVQSLTPSELRVLRVLAALPSSKARDLSHPGLGQPPIPTESGLSRLLAKGFAQATAINPKTGNPFYKLTRVGRAVATAASQALKPSEPMAPEAIPPKEPIAT